VVAALSHLEVLGPRASLDAWLAALQDAGVCHLADALRDLEGEPGVGRPDPTPEEQKALLVRHEAARSLRSVERVLPPIAAAGEARPVWRLGPGDVGAGALLALREEAREIARRLRADVAAVREVGPRGRVLLESLEDAERRDAAWPLLAATRHVAAARVWVPAADEASLRARLEASCGDTVVVRPLAAADDAPAPSRIGRAFAAGLLSRAVLLVLGVLLGLALAGAPAGSLLLAGALLLALGVPHALALRARSPGPPFRPLRTMRRDRGGV